jgi:asparagine synthase (glutamine-hydrolysing)
MRKSPDAIVTDQELLALASATERFGSDGIFTHADKFLGMGCQPLHTHRRSNLEAQPCTDWGGNTLTFDGRLDNHEDLQELLGLSDPDVADSAIILAAFQRWGEQCFSRLVGDWALALWCGAERTLYLARDHAGTRTLYFEMSGETVLWSTYLETFLMRDGVHELDETYAAAYLGCQPVRDGTPYKGIRTVLPAHYLVIKGNQITRRAHWSWMVKGSTTYKSERDYDEHFLSLFRQAVDRRTAHGEPILAQLSGGWIRHRSSACPITFALGPALKSCSTRSPSMTIPNPIGMNFRTFP